MSLLFLTKDGATHGVVNEVIAALQEAKKYDLLPIMELLASLVLKYQADQEWIKRRFAMLQMATIPTVEGAEVLLEIMIEESKETN